MEKRKYKMVKRKRPFVIRCSTDFKTFVKEIQVEALKRGKVLSEGAILDIISEKHKKNGGILLL